MAERNQSAERLFGEALDLQPDHRSAFLDQACREAPELRRLVEELLLEDQRAGSFLAQPLFTQEQHSTPIGLASGAFLGPYRIESKLGEGGMGQVFRATDTRLGRAVAIKITREQFNDRFEREARVISSLNHPNIVVLHDIAVADGLDYIVMEYLPGRSLDRLIGQKPLPLTQANGYIIQIASALAAAYAVGVVHRDIKPANIMVMPDSQLKLLDFGLSKLSERDVQPGDETRTALTGRNVVMGTINYMSPEQASGQMLDHRSDIFSLGVVLFELVSGERPFRGSSQVETMHAIIHAPYSLPPTMPPAFAEILAKALAKDPKDRYQHAGDFALDLRRFQHALENGSVLGAGGPGERAASRRLLWVAAASLLIIAVGVGWLVLRWKSSDVNPLDNAVFTRLTDFPGSELAAEISPDGKFVVFISDRDGPYDLFLTQVGSGRFQNLTQGKATELLEITRSTGFSGDGSEIWYRLGPVTTPGRLIGLVPMFGGDPRPFLEAVSVSWSPDGNRIVYHKGSPPGDPIFVADRTGANAKQIFIDPNSGGHCHYPVWSRDGRWIYFVRGNLATLEMDIWRISPEGGEPERLTSLNSNINYLAPLDVHMLLYTATGEDGSGPWLWALDLDNKKSRRVSFGLESYLSVASSADGQRVVATVSNPSASLWSIPLLDHPVGEQDAKPYPVPTVRALAPRFGGHSLFYLSSLGGGDGLFRYRDNQSLEIWKGANGPLFKPPAISADGRRIAISLTRQGRITLNVMSDDGLGATPLARAIDVRGTVSWSPDGRWIAAGGRDAQGPGLFRIPVDGGSPVRLSKEAAFDPVWSPDGTVIIYSAKVIGRTQALKAVRPDGTIVEMPDIQVREDGERYRFLPDGKRLVFMEGINRHLDFAVLDLETMKTRPLSRFTDPSVMKVFDITPDGKEIVFDRLRENSDVVLIDVSKHQ